MGTQMTQIIMIKYDFLIAKGDKTAFIINV
jgi:hypothetical protein